MGMEIKTPFELATAALLKNSTKMQRGACWDSYPGQEGIDLLAELVSCADYEESWKDLDYIELEDVVIEQLESEFS